ncbi:MAG: YlbF family regulator [Lachnospiraceae bacterium]|nr:YlbF family regulator [Lachnospiraceae bacterium]
MDDFKRTTDEYLAALRNTDACRAYFSAKEDLMANPTLKKQVDEYRRKNFEMQQNMDSDALFDAIDSFEKEYESFRQNPLVARFLAAELAYCRLYQQATDMISASFAEDFDMREE